MWDAELALGLEPHVRPDAAIVGTDEFLENLQYAGSYSPRIAMLRGSGETLRLTGPAASRFITLTSCGYSCRRGSGAA